jgi:benzoyl-CoA reductase/2-hydroxyglutaryl-CoA dehydratase subunit BcrC/BadD/HgdB
MAEPAQEKTTATKSTETAKKVRAFVRRMYTRALEAKNQGKPVAYCMVASQYDEILYAMDIEPVWTENYAGLCAAKHMAEDYLTNAESEGYSRDICGYARTGIGFDALRCKLGNMPPDAPDGGMAKPDLLLGTGVCEPRYKWYQALGRYMDTPIYCIDLPFPPVDADLDAIKGYYVNYVREELKGLIDFLESQLGKKMDYDRLSQGLYRAEKARRLWLESYELRKAVPCPMAGQDSFNVFVPAFCAVCDEETLPFYQELHQEIKARVDAGIGAIPNEKYRLLWGGGLPPWHSMNMFDYFQNLGAVFVRETAYRPPDPFDIPSYTSDPLEIIALRAFHRFTYRHERACQNSGDPEVELLLEFIREYKADGMVMHASTSCRFRTIGQTHYNNLIRKYLEIPVLFLQSDIIDTKNYSKAQIETQIDAFVEVLGDRKDRQARV